MTFHAIIKYCFLEMASNADRLVVINRLERALVVRLIAPLLCIYGTAVFFYGFFSTFGKEYWGQCSSLYHTISGRSIGDSALLCTIL